MKKRPITTDGAGSASEFRRGALAWDRVVRATSPTEVLAAVSEATGCLLRCVRPDATGETAGSEYASSETWTVEATGSGPPETSSGAARLGLDALEAWEAARAEVRRANLRAADHGLDADALQDLGQRLASARSTAELLAAAADTLHGRVGVDACGMVGRLGGETTAIFCVFRAGIQVHLPAIVRRALEAAGEDAGASVTATASPAVGFNPALPSRSHFADADVVIAPFPAGPGARAVLAVLPTDEPDARARRIAQGVASVLALHAARMAALARDEDLRFRAILDAMPQAVWLLDREVRVVRDNPAAAALARGLGWSPEQRAGRIGTFDLASAVMSVLDGGPAVTDSDVRIPEGRAFSVTVSAMGSATGRVRGAVVVADDVTEARRLQSRISQAERLSSLGRMLSGVAHELNNPLATVIGFAEMVRAAPDAPGLEKRLRLIHDEANRCRRIVGNLLRFARRQDPERTPVVLNEIVEATAGLLAYPLRVDGIRLEIELDRSLPALLADPHELQQVVINLVTNSQQAMRAADRTGAVRVRTALQEDGTALLEVRDDGPGVPDDIRDRIFDPFFTTKPSGEGTGLGLSLVYATVRAHGGSVEVGDDPGGGAVFRVHLPIVSIGSPRKAGDGNARPSASLAGARVLVVDDEPGVAQLICEALTAEGCRTTAANDAETVGTLLREKTFDLVVCDLRMARLGAERLHPMLAREAPGLERWMILTSGDTVSLQAEAVAESTGAILVHKPFDLQALREAVRAGLDRRGRS